MIKIVYACNDGYFDGLYLSILSIIRRTKQPIQFFLLSADCTEVNPNFTLMSAKKISIITKLVKSYNKKNSFKLINCQKIYNSKIKNTKNSETRFSPYCLFRLFLHLFPIFKGKVIYLDIDTMACGDIKELYDVELEDNEFAVCHDALGRYWIKRDYFNSGVILFNMDQIRKNKTFEKALKLIQTKKLFFVDQTALYKSVTKYMYFPDDEFRFNRQQVKIRQGDIIKHFCERVIGWPFLSDIKQWDIKHVHSILKIHLFDDDFAIYNKAKNQWQKRNK